MQLNKCTPMAWLKDDVFSFEIDLDSFFKKNIQYQVHM